jgi:hypothetical protein
MVDRISTKSPILNSSSLDHDFRKAGWPFSKPSS